MRDRSLLIRPAVSSLVVSLFVLASAPLAAGGEPPYEDDPAIVAQLKALRPGESLLLPPVKVVGEGIERYRSWYTNGPGQRDYCNKMAWAADRGTALYAGGNHAVPHRLNDVWEYHLGSNTWHLLYGPDGGNPGRWKGAFQLITRTLAKNPGRELTAAEQAGIDGFRQWWNENVVFEDGHVTTKRGGPIMPAHTWDAFTYDPVAKRLLWGMGANPGGSLTALAYFSGIPRDQLESRADRSYTPMWMFDPAGTKWINHKTDKPRPAFRGMGATLCWLPDREQALWYVAAENVSPPAYEMWLFSVAKDEWTELKPNGGKSIRELATRARVAPMSEVQTAYSPKHGKLVAVLQRDTFVYDLDRNEWTKATSDEAIFGHDAHSVFAYDDAANAFLLAFPPGGRGKQLALAAYSLDANRWEVIEPDGPAIPATRYGSYMGYYDPVHEAFVVQGRNSSRMWVYRHKR